MRKRSPASLGIDEKCRRENQKNDAEALLGDGRRVLNSAGDRLTDN